MGDRLSNVRKILDVIRYLTDIAPYLTDARFRDHAAITPRAWAVRRRSVVAA
jgi:hypothetical protein